MSNGTLSARDQLYLDIQTVVAGHTQGDAMIALVESLAALIGIAAADKPHAEAMCRAIGGDVRRCVELNWQPLRQLRAQTLAHRAAGTTRA